MVVSGVIGLAFLVAIPAAAQGNGNGKGGGGKGSPDIPLVVVFRDAAGDALRSDGAAYIHGSPGVKEAVLSDSRNIYLDISPKNEEHIRSFVIDLSAAEQLVEGDPPPSSGAVQEADLGVYADDGFGHNTEGGVAAVTSQQWARLPLFFADPNVRRSSWKLSYSKSSFRDGTEGVGFALVDCALVVGSNCTAWVAHKDGPELADSSVPNRASLISFVPDEADAGEWRIPFAIGFCVLDYVRTTYASMDPGEACRMLLESHPVFGAGE